MWTPKTSNKSKSSRADTSGRTFMTPFAAPSGSSSAVSNESGNDKGRHNNMHGSFGTYLPGSFAARSSTNIVGLPSGVQQTQGSVPNMRSTTNVLTNEFSQLSFGSSHGHPGVTNTGGPALVPNKGHIGLNSFGGFVSADGRGSSSTGLPNVPGPSSGLNLSAPRMVPIPGNSYIGSAMPHSQNQFQDETGHFSYMGLLNDPIGDDDANVGADDLCHLSKYYSSVGDPQGQPGIMRTNNFSFFHHNQYFGIPNEGVSSWSEYQGGLNIRGVVDYSATQRQKEHLMQSQQYPMGRSPGFTFGAINSSHYPLQDQDSSISGTGFSFPTPGNQDSSISGTGFSFPMPSNQDFRFHGSGDNLMQQYQHVQQSQPRFYNPLRGKEVASVQGSQLGPGDYGLHGLLKIIKGVNPAKTSLALGVDPHSLGLELNSSEPLHQKFASPWSEEPVKEGPQYNTPECYNSKQPPPLKRSHFRKFHLPLLFYIFYSMPNDQAQLFAANELHDREWYYHKELRIWFTRDTNSVPVVKNATYEVGCYICFDPNTWQTVRQENVVLYYEMIEKRPTIPW